MIIDPFFFKAVLWYAGITTGVIAFVGAGIFYWIRKMALDIGEIKTTVAVHSEKHDQHSETLKDHNDRIKALEHG